MLREGKSDLIGWAVDMESLPDRDFPPADSLWGAFHPQDEKPWAALSASERCIMDKMEAVGTPLKEWDVTINYGIKTGYNDAFVIDDATRQALIAEDPKSAEIIKPILRGRDIQRYQAEWAELWLIDSHNGYGDVPAVNMDDYPAIKNHLGRFLSATEKATRQGQDAV